MTPHPRTCLREVLCAEEWRESRCSRTAGHDGLHSAGAVSWGFRAEPEPFVAEWRRRVLAKPNGMARVNEGGAPL